MINKTAFHSLSYGLYIIGAKAGDRRAGCVVNTFQQVTSSPLQVSVALNKENTTTGIIEESGCFTATCLAQDATMELIGAFGFHSSATRDKFAEFNAGEDASGVPYIAEQCVSRFSARVVQTLDLGTHLLFVGEVVEADVVCAGEPMTYAYYHQVKGGKTPPKASSYLGEDAPSPASGVAQVVSAAANAVVASATAVAGIDTARNASTRNAQDDTDVELVPPATPKYAWRCTVCGHIEYVDELPDDYTCLICGVGKEMFERIEL